MLNAKINQRSLKTKNDIQAAVEGIIQKDNVGDFIQIEIGTIKQQIRVQVGKGRPGKNTKYRIHEKNLYTLTWMRNAERLKQEANTDGIFPLLCTDKSMSAKETLKAYKYQPRLEKRFTQFKSNHNAAPLLFKKIERIEANMFLFFISLILQALIERSIRKRIKDDRIIGLEVYPEERITPYPTTNKVLNVFESISASLVFQGAKTVEEFKDELTETQQTILNFLGITQDQYWRSAHKSKK